MGEVLSGGRWLGVASEGLGVAVAIALLLALRLTLPAAERGRLGLPATTLALHLVAYAGIVLSAAGTDARRVLKPISLLFLLASIARSAVLLFVDVAGQRLKRPLPKISRDIAQGLAYGAVGMLALREAGVEPGSLLTTSALLTAVIGLSLQETLGNLFAGLAIELQHPFEIGDWIQFDADPKHIGRVVEINWRATRVMTLDEVELIVPNATL